MQARMTGMREANKSRASESKERVMIMASIIVGDRVQYSKTWLRSTSCCTGNIPRAKGQVTEIKNLGSISLAVIEWNLPDVPAKVNVKNLSKLK
jgi:hypothetical protein